MASAVRRSQRFPGCDPATELRPEPRVEQFSALFRAHLPALYNFVRREIAYRVAMGDLGPDDATPDDVVAAVAVRARREFDKEPHGPDFRAWLIHLAIQELEGEVKRLSKVRERVAASVEEDIPETPPAQEVSTLGDEVLDFHQPDEDLKVEDTIHAPVPTPEEILEHRELQQYIARTLAELPPAWRRAFVLRYVEDLPTAEVARVAGETTKRSSDSWCERATGCGSG